MLQVYIFQDSFIYYRYIVIGREQISILSKTHSSGLKMKLFYVPGAVSFLACYCFVCRIYSGIITTLVDQKHRNVWDTKL